MLQGDSAVVGTRLRCLGIAAHNLSDIEIAYINEHREEEKR
jgi:hypothetical protein